MNLDGARTLITGCSSGIGRATAVAFARAGAEVWATARDPESIRDLGEEAGRTVLTDPQRFGPDRYERFVRSVLSLIWPAGKARRSR